MDVSRGNKRAYLFSLIRSIDSQRVMHVLFLPEEKCKHLRSALHSDGADVVQSAIMNVAALGGELQALALEMLLLEHSHLREEKGQEFSWQYGCI